MKLLVTYENVLQYLNYYVKSTYHRSTDSVFVYILSEGRLVLDVRLLAMSWSMTSTIHIELGIVEAPHG